MCLLSKIIIPMALAAFHLPLRGHKNPISHSTNINGGSAWRSSQGGMLGKENCWLKVTKMNQIGSKEQELGQDAPMAPQIRKERKDPRSWSFPRWHVKEHQPQLVHGKVNKHPLSKAKHPEGSWYGEVFRETHMGKDVSWRRRLWVWSKEKTVQRGGSTSGWTTV